MNQLSVILALPAALGDTCWCNCSLWSRGTFALALALASLYQWYLSHFDVDDVMLNEHSN